MANELKRCPFCNSTDVSVNRSEITCMSWVSCTSCGLETPSETGVTDEQVISYWNTRHAAPVEGLETVGYVTPEWISNRCLSHTINYEPSPAWTEAVVTRSQAEAIIAAERERADAVHKADAKAFLSMNSRYEKAEADNAALAARVKELELIRDSHSQDTLQALLEKQAIEAQLSAARKAARLAHDTLIEINPSNYNHDDVCQMNDASVEAIFLLADVLGETHGKTAEWWELRRAALSALEAHP